LPPNDLLMEALFFLCFVAYSLERNIGARGLRAVLE
jgi:hypothetical protein